MAKVIQFSIKLKPQKHLEVSSRMESTMKQMINQMNQLSFHLLKLRINKDKTWKWTFQQFNVTSVWRWDIIQKYV
jgi:hypothetical protein